MRLCGQAKRQPANNVTSILRFVMLPCIQACSSDYLTPFPALRPHGGWRRGLSAFVLLGVRIPMLAEAAEKRSGLACIEAVLLVFYPYPQATINRQ